MFKLLCPIKSIKISSKHRLKQIAEYSILILFLISLTSCNSGGNLGSSPNTNGVNNLVLLGNVTTIPLVNNQPGYTYMVITNNTNSRVTLTNTTIQQNNLTLPANNSLLDASDCISIDKHLSCKVKLYKPQTSGNYLLTMTFSDTNGNNYTGSQIISYSSLVPVQDGFYYSLANNQIVTQAGAQTTLVVPFVLGTNYNAISVKSLNDEATTNFLCPNNSYATGNLCTAFITLDGSTSYSLHNIQIALQGDFNGGHNFTALNLSITSNIIANLITSALNITVSPANGSSPQLIWLNNTGLTTATSITIAAATPVSVTPGTCGTTLANGSSCSFSVNVNSSFTNGQAPVLVSYFDGTSTQILSFNVLYVSSILAPSLSLITNSNRLNNVSILDNGIAFLPITVTNTGSQILNNISFNQISAQNPVMNYFGATSTCQVSGGSLDIGESCVLGISYQPVVVQSGTLTLFPTANYINQNGQTITYSSASLAIPYSSTNTDNFIVVGNYGTVLNSTSGSAWTVDVNTPTAAAATAVNTLINNGNTYVLGTSTATVLQSIGGLIWSTAGTIAATTAIVGLATDGTTYYAAGSGSAATRGIYKTTTLSGAWTQAFNSASNPNNLFRVNTSYVAPLTTSSTTDLATSANGTTWVTPTISGTARVYNTALYDGSNFYAWNTAGFNAESANVTTGWTQNAVAPAGGPSVTDSVFNAGTYVLTTSSDIFTTTNATAGPYTNRLAVALNSVAFGNSIYIAVGNGGLIYSSPDAITWTQRASGLTANNLTNSFYDGTFFWVTGANGTILVSPDGINWALASLNSIGYNGTVYIAVGSNGLIYTSSNLTSWSKQTSGTTQVLNKIACILPTLCYVLGNNGTIESSANGTSWSTQTSGTTANLNAMACGINKCIIVGQNGTILSSYNLGPWTAVTSPTTQNLNSISFFYTIYVAVGNNGTIITSPDGQSWTIESSGVSLNLNGVKCSVQGCVVVGATGFVETASVLGSPWIFRNSATTNNLNAIAYYGGSFVAVGNSNTTMISTNHGVNWTANAGGLANTNANLVGIFAY